MKFEWDEEKNAANIRKHKIDFSDVPSVFSGPMLIELDERLDSERNMSKQSKTDWKALEAMTDEEIDYSDIPPLPDAFFERARLWQPKKQVTVTMHLDSDVLEWFQKQDQDWEKRM
jgi:uncharacterized protein (DUF4415 family)